MLYFKGIFLFKICNSQPLPTLINNTDEFSKDCINCKLRKSLAEGFLDETLVMCTVHYFSCLSLRFHTYLQNTRAHLRAHAHNTHIHNTHIHLKKQMNDVL